MRQLEAPQESRPAYASDRLIEKLSYSEFSQKRSPPTSIFIQHLGQTSVNILKEDIFNAINSTPFGIKKTSIVRDNVFELEFFRDENLQLVFKLASTGYGSEEFTNYPAGTIRTSDGTIEFTLLGGAEVKASNVIHRNSHIRSIGSDKAKTIDTYTAHQVELIYGDRSSATYTVEWVGNLSDRMIFTDSYTRRTKNKEKLVVGKRSNPLEIESSHVNRQFSTALYLNIDNIDIYIIHEKEGELKKLKRGVIIYGSVVPREQRDKIRNCISFAFGLPIFLFGETEFDLQWLPVRRKSFDVNAIDGAAFKITPQPPYPINDDRFENVLDPAALSSVVRCLLEHYENIKLSELFWIYWHALCAPMHSAPVQFGGAIEQLQRSAPKIARAVRTKLIDDDHWKDFSRPFIQAVNEMKLDEISTKILINKISNLNQAPQGLVFTRMIDNLGLKLSSIEKDAWRHRNISAHGDISDDYEAVILNAKLLRLLFHKFLAGVTYCSDRYIDYYSLGFPIRALDDEIPPRV